ncbi:MAG: agmatine deiminase family protein [Muribaculaceae bacterium]|nr:agmatine deiminase family protein [Muribaculaceae bacterium]
MDNLKIYTSKYLELESPETKSVADAIYKALDELHVSHGTLPMPTNENYWIRDYMPVMVSADGTYAKYQYYPDYLVDYKTYRKTIVNQENACMGLNIFAPYNINIIFDGGNYVRCGNKVIMTDKIFSENPKWSVHSLLEHLRKTLCCEDIILLPWDMKDFCGHSDGMVAPLDDKTILLNSCWKKKNKAFHRRLLKILKAHFDVIELSYDCKEDINSWCYLNFLKVPNGILLPCLSEEAKCDNDQVAVSKFKQLFPNLEIKPVYAEPLIKKNGALHCVTWEYIERK